MTANDPREFYRERANALSQFIHAEFDQHDEQSWSRLDVLYRAAITARDVARIEARQ